MQEFPEAPAGDTAADRAPTLHTGFETGSIDASVATPTTALLVHHSGLRMYPVLLEAQSGGERAIAGIATVAIRSETFVPPSRALLATLAAALLENDDVDPVTRIG